VLEHEDIMYGEVKVKLQALFTLALFYTEISDQFPASLLILDGRWDKHLVINLSCFKHEGNTFFHVCPNLTFIIIRTYNYF
jgi:hypothetical protein